MIKRILLCALFVASTALSTLAFAGGPELKPNPWIFYFGGFGGFYSADFTYHANYFSNNNSGSNQEFNNTATQNGVSGGGQIGINYHFNSPYLIGLVFSGAMNANNARLVEGVENQIAPLAGYIDINNRFQINYNLDIAALFGIDITPQTHAYVKVGASDASLTDVLFVTRGNSFPFPTPFNQRTERRNIWGWLFGLGLTRDLNKWLSAFVEYNYYAYPSRNTTLQNISPLTSAAARDLYTQNVSAHASTIRLGLNVSFGNTYWVDRYLNAANNNFMFYLGVFGGYYSADFAYGATYFSSGAGGSTQSLGNDAIQHGISGGGQVGIQYHFRSPYFLGLAFTGAMNANKGRLAEGFENALTPNAVFFDLNNEFRVNPNYDIAAIFGADITPQTHIYGKLGAAFATFRQNLFVTRGQNFPFPIPSTIQSSTKDIYGWVLGAGLTHDITKLISAFIEYDYFNYGRYNLNALDNISPNITAAQSDRLTQHIEINASTFRIGLNFNFENHYIANKLLMQPQWLAYIGGFGGYYNAQFEYGANYFSSAIGGGNQTFNNAVLQHGISGGGQVGVEYQFQHPYFAGFVFSGSFNANKARLTSLVDGAQSPIAGFLAFDIRTQFRINFNFDMAAIFGFNVTALTQIYGKLGASYASLAYQLSTTQNQSFPFPSVFFQQTTYTNIWGWVVGVGLRHDLSRYVNLFAEYDHYGYGTNELNTFENIVNAPAGQSSRITQHLGVAAFAVHVGLNVKFRL